MTTTNTPRYASTLFRMPAMSPTMTEGGIASWKIKQGESFQAGDVLLEIETDKATIDVEAQDDGIVGRILAQDGASKIPVGQIIAILAEEGDDISKISIPTSLAPEDTTSASSSSTASSSTTTTGEETASPSEIKQVDLKSGLQPVDGGSGSGSENRGHEVKHLDGKGMFPSVMRLLIESNLSQSQIDNIKASGRHGMLTKGDVLFALGKIQDSRGSAIKLKATKYGVDAKSIESTSTTPQAAPKAPELILDGPAFRRLILGGLEKATKQVQSLSSATNAPISATTPTLFSQNDFDAVLSPYASLFEKERKSEIVLPTVEMLHKEKNKQVKKDEWDGLF